MNASISILTGGKDKHYATALASALLETGASFDFVGSDEVDAPELHGNPRVNFFNLRGEQSVNAGLTQKIRRIAIYYFRLFAYAATARPKIFHILWNNKFDFVDRVLLMSWYRLFGKKIIFTAHNINAGARDATDREREVDRGRGGRQVRARPAPGDRFRDEPRDRRSG